MWMNRVPNSKNSLHFLLFETWLVTYLMDYSACKVKIVTQNQQMICAVDVEPKFTVMDVKKKVEVVVR